MFLRDESLLVEALLGVPKRDLKNKKLVDHRRRTYPIETGEKILNYPYKYPLSIRKFVLYVCAQYSCPFLTSSITQIHQITVTSVLFFCNASPPPPPKKKWLTNDLDAGVVGVLNILFCAAMVGVM